MKNILAEIFSDKIEKLFLLKTTDAAKYKEELDDFLNLVLKTSKTTGDLHGVTQKLHDISETLGHPSIEADKAANTMYMHMSDGYAKRYLTKAAIAMHRAAVGHRFFESYRMMFIQAEIIYSYLEYPFGLKSWAIARNKEIKEYNQKAATEGNGQKKFQYTINQLNTSPSAEPVFTVSPGSKPYILNDFFSEHTKSELIASSTITLVKRMRDYVSHGQHENENNRLKPTIGDATVNFDIYLDKWCMFLSTLTTHLS